MGLWSSGQGTRGRGSWWWLQMPDPEPCWGGRRGGLVAAVLAPGEFFVVGPAAQLGPGYKESCPTLCGS